MEEMRTFIIQVSIDMKAYGEITDEVLEEARNRLKKISNKTYDELNDPDLSWQRFVRDQHCKVCGTEVLQEEKQHITEDMLIEVPRR